MEETTSVHRDPQLEDVFSVVLERQGIDLGVYRRSSIGRRVGGRLHKLGYRNCREYLNRLREDPEESRYLIQHVTIKVSHFFRDAEVYRLLQETVLPAVLKRSSVGAPVSIWSAGCGNGEEAYSLAILAEEISREKDDLPSALVLGTDVDEEALAAARRGLYPENALQETPAELIDRYFMPHLGRYRRDYEILSSLHNRVRFSRHNLLSGSAPSEGPPFDLILCRNVLIYFEAPAQGRVFDLLTGNLAEGGYLCLGEAEQLPIRERTRFEVISQKARVYRLSRPEGH